MTNTLYRAPIIRASDVRDRDSYQQLETLRQQLADLTYNRRRQLQPSVYANMARVLASCIDAAFYEDAAREFDRQLAAIATRELSTLHWQYAH